MFSEISIWTMVHGIGLSGGALLGMAIALFYLVTVRPAEGPVMTARQVRAVVGVLTASAVALWLATLVGTYVIFPAYRATPPEGVADLAAFPRALILSDPESRWLHAFAMETKEHVPWIAAMLTTAVVAVGLRHGRGIVADARLRKAGIALLATSFALVSYVALLGIFVNKFAPLE